VRKKERKREIGRKRKRDRDRKRKREKREKDKERGGWKNDCKEISSDYCLALFPFLCRNFEWR
jgi:hypothetical protein